MTEERGSRTRSLVRRLGAAVIVLLVVVYVVDARDEASDAKTEAEQATSLAQENAKALAEALRLLRDEQGRAASLNVAIVALTEQLRTAGLTPVFADRDGDGVPEPMRGEPGDDGEPGEPGEPGPAGSPAPRQTSPSKPPPSASPKPPPPSPSPSPRPCTVRNPLTGACLLTGLSGPARLGSRA